MIEPGTPAATYDLNETIRQVVRELLTSDDGRALIRDAMRSGQIKNDRLLQSLPGDPMSRQSLPPAENTQTDTERTQTE